MGATRKPMKIVYVKNPPSVSVPATIWRVPTYMTTAPTTPSMTDDAEAHEEPKREKCHRRRDPEEHDKRDRRRQEAARELDEARADEVPHAVEARHYAW